jgi:hypothetical protein
LKQVMRIKGLVRLADHVRREIGRGVPARQRLELRETVHRATLQDDTILRDRGAPPSRHATHSGGGYIFINGNNWAADR